MRFLYLITILLSLTNYAWGQNAFAANVRSVSTTMPANEPAFYKWIELINKTGLDLPMHWRIVEESLPNGWVALVEDVDTNYHTHMDSADFVLPAVVAPGDYMIVSFQPNNVVGTGRVVLNLYPQNDVADSLHLTYIGITTAGDTTDTTTAIVDAELLEWAYYPNPATEQLYLQSSLPIKAVQLLDMNGKLILDQPSQSSASTVDISAIAAGVYLLHVEWDNGSTATELLKIE